MKSPEHRWWFDDEWQRMMDLQRARFALVIICQAIVIGTLLLAVWLVLHGR